MPVQQRRDPTIAIATILAGQGKDGLGESIFVVALCRPVALRAAWLLHHTARMPLAHPMRRARMDSPHSAVVHGSEVMGWSAPIPTGAHYIKASAEGDRHEEAH